MTVVSGTVLITGASGGIGAAIARAFAARGASLVLSGRRAAALEPLAAELGGRVVLADLGEPDGAQELARAAGTVDVLVANAAVPASGRLLELEPHEIDRMVAVNLAAPIALARALAPAMAAHRRGHLVFVASLSGKVASPASSIYSATKFGLRGFALGLRADLRPHGVGVSVVNPGFVSEAGMFADTGVTLPLGVGTVSPEQVAAAVVRAVERNRAEIDVAPVSLRIGAALAGLAPGPAAAVARRLGSVAIAEQMAAAQSAKRS